MFNDPAEKNGNKRRTFSLNGKGNGKILRFWLVVIIWRNYYFPIRACWISWFERKVATFQKRGFLADFSYRNKFLKSLPFISKSSMAFVIMFFFCWQIIIELWFSWECDFNFNENFYFFLRSVSRCFWTPVESLAPEVLCHFECQKKAHLKAFLQLFSFPGFSSNFSFGTKFPRTFP